LALEDMRTSCRGIWAPGFGLSPKHALAKRACQRIPAASTFIGAAFVGALAGNSSLPISGIPATAGSRSEKVGRRLGGALLEPRNGRHCGPRRLGARRPQSEERPASGPWSLRHWLGSDPQQVSLPLRRRKERRTSSPAARRSVSSTMADSNMIALPPARRTHSVSLGVRPAVRERNGQRATDETPESGSRHVPHPIAAPTWYTAVAMTKATVVLRTVEKIAHFHEPLSRRITARVTKQGA